MVVKDPKPRNAFVLQAEPATLFGPCENISGSSWVYQNTKVVAKTNFHPQGLTDHDLNWVKTNIEYWDAPNAPVPAPPAHLYDATALEKVTPVGDGATRETATCPACLQKRRKQKPTSRHTLVWGECLHATPPPPVVIAPMPSPPEVPADDEEEEEAPDRPVASAAKVRMNSDPDSLLSKRLSHPHACMAVSDIATWGSSDPSVVTDTDVPSSSESLSFYSDDEIDFDDEFVVHGGACLLYTSPSPRD